MLVRLTSNQIKKFDEEQRGIPLTKYLKDTIEAHVQSLDSVLDKSY
jgi:hypothetical protein